MQERTMAWESGSAARPPHGYWDYTKPDRNRGTPEYQRMPLPKQMTALFPNAIFSQAQPTPKRYKAYFKGVTEAERAEFKTATCLVPVSLHQYYHDGTQLEAILHLASKSFKKCKILVADTLQRHSLCITNPNKSEEELYNIAKLEGEEWIQRNQCYLNQLTTPYGVDTWDRWLQHNEFPKYLELVTDLYNTDPIHKARIDASIHEFIKRNEARQRNYKAAFDLSVTYVLEEAAAFCIWASSGYSFTIYPTQSMGSMMDAIYEKLIQVAGAKHRFLTTPVKKLTNGRFHES